jgi:acyl-CoA ligase (AMP-forming) (exosortase A-associated)
MDFLIHHLLRTSALRFPEKEALVHGEQRLTYAEVMRKTAGLAHGLRCAGLQRGDRVGIYLEPSVPQVISIFGISKAGGVFVPINSLLFPDQVSHIATDCRMRGLITTTSKLSTLAAMLTDIQSMDFLVVLSDGVASDLSIPTHSFEEMCRLAAPEERYDIGIGLDLVALLYTSGSTGKAKGVMLSHAQIIAGSSIVSDYLNITCADRILAVLPFSFDAGLNQLITAFQQGGTLVLIKFTFAGEIVQALLKEQITGLAGVPTLWSLLVQPNSPMHSQRFPHLRYITNTGGTMPQSVLATLRQALPATKIYLMYGLTEAFRSTYLPPEELDSRPNSIGKAIPNTEILVVNNQGRPCRAGQIGELVHRGPTVAMGYWGEPELSARVFRPHPFLPPELADGEKVCYSGDLVKFDEEGFLYFVGRRDAMIKSAGFRISPTEVEEVLMRSGWLQAAAVIGTPDELLGQSIKAFVVPNDEMDFARDALLSYCAERIPRYMVPKSVEVLGELPKTPSGKVDYPALRRREGP